MLANFKKTAYQLDSDFDRWMYALKDESLSGHKLKLELLKPVPSLQLAAHQSKPLRYFYAQLYSQNIGTEALAKYEEEIILVNKQVDTTFLLGKAEGIAEGIAKGKAEGKVTFARVMLSKGKHYDEISELTGLTVDEINELRQGLDQRSSDDNISSS
jgi:predicted transposase/invertase (TIGR01784 family)